MTARRNVLLLVLVVVLLVVATVGGWVAWQRRGEGEDPERQAVLGSALAAATSHAAALVNLRHDDPATLEALRHGVSGDLLDDYEPGGEVVEGLERDRSELEGRVVWAGIEQITADTATALVATSGTVTSRRTDGEQLERELRLRVSLVRQQGRWLVDDVELVA